MYSYSKAALEAITHGHSWLMPEIHRLFKTIDQMRKICTIKQIPAHISVDWNEAADKLFKEARDLNNNTKSLVMLDDANAIAYYRLKGKTVMEDHQICEIDANRELKRRLLDRELAT